MAHRLAALLWDVDGTLAETELEGHRPAFNAAFADLGLPWHWDRSTYLRLLAVSGGRERIAAWSAEQQGRPADPQLLEQLVQRKRLHYGERVRRGAVPLRPGVAELIGEARAAGLLQGIVTTSGRSAVQDLCDGVLGELAGAFAFRVCGEDVRAKKPDPQAYQLALTHLAGLDAQAARAGSVLVLEDSRNGLEAAVAAGLPCLVTLSSLSRHEPSAAFAAARAVVDALAVAAGPLPVQRGPACPQGAVTLSYLQSLLTPP
jgi:HAD superfamily hydrolase (TIGR01509 family)